MYSEQHRRSSGGTLPGSRSTGTFGRASSAAGSNNHHPHYYHSKDLGGQSPLSSAGGSYGISRSRDTGSSTSSRGAAMTATTTAGRSTSGRPSLAGSYSPQASRSGGSSPLVSAGDHYSPQPTGHAGHSPPPVPQFASKGGNSNTQRRGPAAMSMPPTPTTNLGGGGGKPYGGISAALPAAPVKSMYSPPRSTTSATRYTTAAGSGRGGRSSPPEIEPNSTIKELDRIDRSKVLRSYKVTTELGKGAFARVFEVRDISSGEIFAVKVVDKSKLTDDKKRQKMMMEIRIHSKLRHPHILQFVREFQDDFYHYLILERCLRSSLMEMSRVRAVFTVAEVQYIMLQLLEAANYLHSENVIHRDLKLANVMVDANLNMKVGDFGLATELQYNGQRKWTKCGTPNYIAPEVLSESEGYNFSCDVWSLGVILYTLLVGIPPFETQTLQHTYTRIQQGKFSFPHNCQVPLEARQLISRMLQCQPDRRPTFIDIRMSPFFKDAPTSAPATLLRSLPEDDFAFARKAIARRREQQSVAEEQQQKQHRQLNPSPSPTMTPSATWDSELQGEEAVFTSSNRGSSLPISTTHPHSSRSSSRPHHPVVPQHSDPLMHIDPRELPTPCSGETPPPPAHSETNASSAGGIGGGRKVPVQVIKSVSTEHHQPGDVIFPSRPNSTTPTGAVPPIPRSEFPMPTPQQQGRPQKSALQQQQQQRHYTTSPTNKCISESFPGVYVTRVLDYSRKYGVSCELNDGSLSAVFNDRTKLLWRLTNGSVAYHCRHNRSPTSPHQGGGDAPLQVDVLHDAFAVDSTGELVSGAANPPQERQTIKKMTLSKYFRNCFDSPSIKERVMVLELFPNPNGPTPTASFMSSTVGSAAASGVYVKSVTSLSALPGCPALNEPPRFEVVSTTTVLPTSSVPHAQEGSLQFSCMVFRFSDGSAQVTWEPSSFCSKTGGFQMLDQQYHLPPFPSVDRGSPSEEKERQQQANQAARTLQDCVSMPGCGATVVLSPEAVASHHKAIRPIAGDGGTSPTNSEVGPSLAAISPIFPLAMCGEGHPAPPTDLSSLLNVLDSCSVRGGFESGEMLKKNGDEVASCIPEQTGSIAASQTVDLESASVHVEGLLVCSLIQVSLDAVVATAPGSLPVGHAAIPL